MKPLAQFWPENWKRYFEPFPFNTIDPKRSYRKRRDRFCLFEKMRTQDVPTKTHPNYTPKDSAEGIKRKPQYFLTWCLTTSNPSQKGKEK